MSDVSTWTVTGMTCGHCVASMQEEVGAIEGVEHVDVVLESGTVTVTSTVPIDRSVVAEAVVEAGFALS
jgi:copper chaperone